MDDIDFAAFFLIVGLLNGVFAMISGSVLFGAIGLFFAFAGWFLIFR